MNLEKLYACFQTCGEVTTDSRNCPSGSMFFALKGATFNGNAFAAQALAQGCAYAVIDEPAYVDPHNPKMIVVDDCLQALQQLAHYHRLQLGTPVIGVTGTNGKTTTKELVATVLQQKYNVLFTQGNLNNHIGVPLTLLKLKPEHEIAVIEMGANHPGEIKTLAEIAAPDYGLITNVGKAHLEGFGSFEGVIRTKGELYDYLRAHGKHTIFLHHENPYLQSMAHELTCMRYGSQEGLYVSGACVQCNPFVTFEWSHGNEKHRVETHLIGTYNVDNLLAAAAIGTYMQIDGKTISEALAHYQPQNSRSQLQQTETNSLIIDAYNANPTSMMAALTNFRTMEVAHKVAILGDMKELGATSAEEHQKIADFVSTCGLERVMLVGPEFSKCHTGWPVYPDAAAVIEELKTHPLQHAYVLIKGSNSMKLVQLVSYL